MPLDLRETIKQQKLPIEACPNERALLNCLFGRIHRFDPDVSRWAGWLHCVP